MGPSIGVVGVELGHGQLTEQSAVEPSDPIARARNVLNVAIPPVAFDLSGTGGESPIGGQGLLRDVGGGIVGRQGETGTLTGRRAGEYEPTHAPGCGYRVRGDPEGAPQRLRPVPPEAALCSLEVVRWWRALSFGAPDFDLAVTFCSPLRDECGTREGWPASWVSVTALLPWSEARVCTLTWVATSPLTVRFPW
jgi:hypothetical protein